MQFVPIELYQLISNLLNTKSQIRVTMVSKFLYDYICILDIKSSAVTDDILLQKKFRNLSKLNYSRKINYSYTRYHNISQKSINNLNLIKLYVSDIKTINNVSHMNNLKVLNAGGKCAINQNSIKKFRFNKIIYG